MQVDGCSGVRKTWAAIFRVLTANSIVSCALM